jgi:hypothetical protein
MSGDKRRLGMNGLWLVMGWLFVGCSAADPAVASARHHGRLAVSESAEDIENRHPEVVRVTTALNGKAKGRCSGVVMAPHLVLTAGHCVCKPRPDTEDGGLIIDNTDCAATATVKTVLYHPKEGVENDVPSESAVYKGTVRPHPRLKIHVNSQGAASGEADLAVIVLEEALGDDFRPARLSGTEVQVGEAILMVGYGFDQRVGGVQGERRSGRNDVATFTLGGSTFIAGKPLQVAQPVMPGGSIITRQAGSYVLEGDSGGPCFRESDGALVGIAMTTSQPPLEFSEFTSTHHHLAWLKAELKRAAEEG